MEEPRDPNLIIPTSAPGQYAVGHLELPLVKAESVSPARVRRAWGERVDAAKIGIFGISLFLFIVAITLMKEGALSLAPLVRDVLAVTSTPNCLGFGWLLAYIIMSGSPIAATALTFFDAGVVDKLGAFAMIAGSRLGASFIVLLIGFLYVLRGRDRATSLSTGLLSLVVTATIYLPGLFLGAGILHAGTFDRLQLGSGALLQSVIDLFVDPIVGLAVSLLPSGVVFLSGLGAILISFRLFDRCLPDMILKESHVGRVSRLIYRPWVMFILGALITLISMSVSLSLSILVPLSNRGFVRRENVIPYIMGANITTFIDTLLAAVLLDNPAAFTVVLVEMLSVTVVSMVILAIVYQRYERTMLSVVAWVTVRNQNLVMFMIVIFTLPIALMLV
jgi:sodium-dependent phosphate cotransporter